MNNLNYLPSGPTAMIFALLAQYYASIPHTYRYQIGTTTMSPTVPTTTTNAANSNSNSATENSEAEQPKPPKPSLTLLLSDKSTTYIVAAQLALSQFPAMLLPAALGWIVGVAWRAEILPGLSPGVHGFRVPAWVVGERERRGVAGGSGAGAERERYEDLRRRLEGEAAASASASGLDGGAAGPGVDRRSETAAVVDRLRGDW
jgi:hypothetical protein